MTTRKQPWFRMYSEVATDRKITRAAKMAGQPKGNALAIWLTVLCAANDSPQRGVLLVSPTLPVMVDEIADIVGYDEADVKAVLDAFETLEMIESVDGIYRILHWGDRQFASDNSTDRVREFRAKKRAEQERARQTPPSSTPDGNSAEVDPESIRQQSGIITETGMKRFRNTPETETESESESLSLNAPACEGIPDDALHSTRHAPNNEKAAVRKIIFELNSLYELPVAEVELLGDEIARSVAAGHSQQVISQAYQEAFARARGPVGPYARAILTNWADTGPPQKGVYGESKEPRGFGTGHRGPNGYAGQAGPGQSAISSLSGQSIDRPIKEIADPKTGETYYVDIRNGERVPTPVVQ